MKDKIISRVFFIVIFIAFLNISFYAAAGMEAQKGPTESAARMKAWAEHLKLKNESLFRNLKWRAVGPRFQGGRIESIACPHGESSTIYVGAGAGNIWKTVNGGVTWEPIFENESTFAIGDIEVSKSNPQVVWVATGENLMARSSYAGTGIFKSKDGGKTWQNMGLQDTHHIGRIVIDPQNPDIVYVAALGHMYTYNDERGLFKTEDGGKTWKKVLYISEKVGVVDVVMDPSDNNILYAAAWERDRKAWKNVVCGEGSGIYKTSDGGLTWKKLTQGFPIGKYIGRIGLDVAPTNPNVVYAVLDNQTPVVKDKEKKQVSEVVGGEIYRSDDKGETWRKVNEGDLYAGIGYSFGDIRVSPDDENTVYVLGVNLLISKDGGKTFQKNRGKVIHLYPHNARVLHLDQHELWIDPLYPRRLILGNDGGVYLSQDRGKTWLHLNNIPIAEFYAISVDNDNPYKIYGGTQDNAALCGYGDREIENGVEDSWEHIWLDLWGGGDSYFTFIDPTDSSLVYYEQQFGNLKRKNLKTGENKSIMPRAKEGEPPLRYNWMTPFIISHHNPYILYYGANKLFKSLNRGDSWSGISPDLTTQPGSEKQGDVPYGTITTISESPLRPGVLYVGTDDGNVWVIQNDGVSWTKIREGLPDKWVSRVGASQYEEGTVYVSLTGYREDDFEKYLFSSKDYGKTWVSIAGNLPAESVNVVREDPKNKNILYVGTDLGVYVSLDKGKSWQSLCNHLPTTPVHDLLVHPRESELVIGTHGRSAFVLDVRPIQELNEEVLKREAHLFEIRPAILPRNRDYSGDWDMETRKKTSIFFYLKSSQDFQMTISDETGRVVKQFKGRADHGLNVVEWDLVLEKEGKVKSVYEPGIELVKPGIYKLEILTGAQKLEGQITVKKFPS